MDVRSRIPHTTMTSLFVRNGTDVANEGRRVKQRFMRRFLSFSAAALVASSLISTGLPGGGLLTGLSAQSTFQIDRSYVTGLSSPTGMKFAPDGRLFVTEQGGAVRIITPGGQLLSTPFMTVGVRSDGERGLLGLAFDPTFTSNGYIYLFYTPNDAAVSRLVRVTASGDRVVSGSQVTIFEYGNFSGNHRGGDLHFGPDGKLYVGLGDAAGVLTPRA